MSNDISLMFKGWLCVLRSENARPGEWVVYPIDSTAILGGFASPMQAIVDDFGNLVRVP